MSIKKQFFIGSCLTITLGGLIYVLFRSTSLLMFEWFDQMNLSKYIIELRSHTEAYSLILPNWLLYSLPDGLWLFSYLSLLLIIWDNKVSKKNIFWIFLLPIIAIVSELGQFFKIVPGTFDIIDLIFYFAGSFLPILFFTNLKQIYYEKNH